MTDLDVEAQCTSGEKTNADGKSEETAEADLQDDDRQLLDELKSVINRKFDELLK